MALLSQQDAMLRLIARVGKSGATAKDIDPKLAPVIDDLRRSLSALEQAIRLFGGHARQGPEWGAGPSREFHVRWDQVDAVTRQQRFAHGLGYVPDRFMVLLRSSTQTGGSVTTWGGLVLVSADKNYITFEIDGDARTNQVNHLVIVWREAMVPVGAEGLSRDELDTSIDKAAGYVDTSNMNG